MKTNYTDVLPPEWKPMSDIFTALGDEHRQRMLMLFEPNERLTAGQISDASTLARTTVSHHLKILRQAEVLLSEKKGKEVWFWINKPLLEQTFGNVLNYLKGNVQ
ncbi:MAG: metalloregulator ArsR/SmtB family transcription factor [Sulfuricurvum sp.]|jgi:DNA-binding transcriptional ArsR family regulator|uniref:ArsR/SmtB family transcription factor n=1 Tax=Sulfuricurvum sp. TaxID=2025608 RepID=UPI0025D5A946|nr:metalloregulator ArsR/SmtB family transcription factor [Sulfuricurvum sp.]MCK9373924.1 metalloregulator ArsR/SmtB family transcription factor [Sulfuricurvum sp.]